MEFSCQVTPEDPAKLRRAARTPKFTGLQPVLESAVGDDLRPAPAAGGALVPVEVGSCFSNSDPSAECYLYTSLRCPMRTTRTVISSRSTS